MVIEFLNKKRSNILIFFALLILSCIVMLLSSALKFEGVLVLACQSAIIGICLIFGIVLVQTVACVLIKFIINKQALIKKVLYDMIVYEINLYLLSIIISSSLYVFFGEIVLSIMQILRPLLMSTVFYLFVLRQYETEKTKKVLSSLLYFVFLIIFIR